KCLEKDPGRRWQNAADLADALRFAAEWEPAPTSASAPASPVRKGRIAAVAMASFVLGASLAALIYMGSSGSADLPVRVSEIPLESDTTEGFPFSPAISRRVGMLLKQMESGAVVVVPPLWFWEVANGLLAAQRRKLLTAAERRKSLQKLSLLNVSVDDEATRIAFDKTSQLAEKHGLSVYDAAYLELALRRKLSLGSRDQALLKAAKRSGVKLLA
ncbi:MAG: type II toxin-antitoxin system VapC family toxin, partial [Acidobacteria bacterium]|nr:type II toxin-antitoxin system VapC family toxin [Acidobacteriota bacterium]